MPNDVGRAVRSAFWVAVEHLGRGEMAPAAGWLAKAERLVGEGGGERVESGYLLVAAAVQSLAMGDPDAALERVRAGRRRSARGSPIRTWSSWRRSASASR